LHGLNPATGWGFAAAWGVGSGDRTKALRALVPIGLGHLASISLVAGAVALGLSMDRVATQVVAGALLAIVAICHLSGHKGKRIPTGKAGLVLWSFMMSSAHGAGLMLVPMLMPLCLGSGATREITASGSLMLALAAVGIHAAAMISVAGILAIGVVTVSHSIVCAWAEPGSCKNPIGSAKIDASVWAAGNPSSCA
jgi:hypothetical protein